MGGIHIVLSIFQLLLIAPNDGSGDGSSFEDVLVLLCDNAFLLALLAVLDSSTTLDFFLACFVTLASTVWALMFELGTTGISLRIQGGHS